MVDQLDVLTQFPLDDQNSDNIVLVNVAPRAEHIKKKWDNGTPFCFFKVKNTLVVSTFEGYCLALARDLGIVSHVQILDIPTVTAAAVAWGELESEQAEKINHTQFRSLEFLPTVAYWIWEQKPIPSKKQSLRELPSPSGQAWQIDNFGNVKTTLLPEAVGFKQGKELTLYDGEKCVCYARLADVPKGATALTIGSSGFGKQRFLEVVVGGCGSAAVRHGFEVGSTVLAQKR